MAEGIKITKKVSLEEPSFREKAKSITKPSKGKGLTPCVGEIIVYVVVILLLSAGTYSRNKIWNNEIEIWADCVEKSPNKARPYAGLGMALLNQGKHREAILPLTAALRIDPGYVEAHYDLGTAFIEQGNYPEALTHLTEALKLNPNHAGAHTNLAVVLLKLDQYSEAMTHLSKALTINPNHVAALYNLGEAYLKVGDRESALKEYEILKTLDPGLAKALREKVK